MTLNLSTFNALHVHPVKSLVALIFLLCIGNKVRCTVDEKLLTLNEAHLSYTTQSLTGCKSQYSMIRANAIMVYILE
jgi:hypothetical protein